MILSIVVLLNRQVDWCSQIPNRGTFCRHPALAWRVEGLPVLAVMATCHQLATNTRPYFTMTPCGCTVEWRICRNEQTSGGGTLVSWRLWGGRGGVEVKLHEFFRHWHSVISKGAPVPRWGHPVCDAMGDQVKEVCLCTPWRCMWEWRYNSTLFYLP